MKQPKIIIITGSVGAGKTTLAKKYSKKGYQHIDANIIVKKHKLHEGYDKKTKSYIVDEKKLARYLEKIIKKARKDNQKLVIDSHLSHYIKPKFVDLCIVVTCNLKKLYKRLAKRGYSKQKIQDNMTCEIMETCLIEAQEHGHKIKKVDGGKRKLRKGKK